MNCPKCDGDTQVLDSRSYWRRRKCLNCSHRFNTIESITEIGYKSVLKQASDEFIVVKKQTIDKPVQKSVKPKVPKNNNQNITVSAVKRSADARRRVEDLLEKRRLDSLNDYFLDPDYDYLPEKW